MTRFEAKFIFPLKKGDFAGAGVFFLVLKVQISILAKTYNGSIRHLIKLHVYLDTIAA